MSNENRLNDFSEDFDSEELENADSIDELPHNRKDEKELDEIKTSLTDLFRKTLNKENLEVHVEKLKDAKGKERSARFVCAMAVAFQNGEISTCKGVIEGLITYEQKGTNGFGYDPIVYVPEFEMTTGEMTPELKNSISHRGKALEQMKEILKGKL